MNRNLLVIHVRVKVKNIYIEEEKPFNLEIHLKSFDVILIVKYLY